MYGAVFILSSILGWELHYHTKSQTSAVAVVQTDSEMAGSNRGGITLSIMDIAFFRNDKNKSSEPTQIQADSAVFSESQSFMAFPSQQPIKTAFYFPVIAENQEILGASVPLQNVINPQFSPDGKRIVFAAGDNDHHDIWIINATGENLVQVTDSQADEIDPFWMSDGRRIVYSTNESRTYELWIMNADGKGEIQITSDGESNKFHPRCAPLEWHNVNFNRTGPKNRYDGNTILYNSVKDNHGTIWMVGEDGSFPTLVVGGKSEKESFDQPEWSPEGLTIIYLRQRGQEKILCEGWNSQKWGKKVKGIHQIPVEGIIKNPQIIPNGTLLTYRKPSQNKKTLYYGALDGSDEKPLVLDYEMTGDYDWSPDGGRFVFVSAIKGDDCLIVQDVSYPLHNVSNLRQYRNYSQHQADKLNQNRFVVTGKQHHLFHRFYESYSMYNDYPIPLFITVDSTLELFHLFFDYSLRIVEEKELYPLLEELVENCHKEIHSLSDEATTQAMKDDLLFLEYFFSVAENLLTNSQETVNDSVALEVSFIRAHQGVTMSPVLGTRIDYTQFTVRGHYTKNETLGRYFQAMLWLGQVKFRAESRENPQKALIETRRALIITHLLLKNPNFLNSWEKLFSTVSFFVGGGDDFHVQTYADLMDGIFVDHTNEEFYEQQKLISFLARVSQQEGPRIQPQDDRSFRFMPQRFTPDSYIHQKLVFPEVGTSDNPRLLPRGLDIMAVLGSERAYDILDRVFEATKYEKFSTGITDLKREFLSVSIEDWNKNIYWGWLYMLRGLLPEFDETYPPFMRNDAWQDKSLSTALASWTELRHDTILYVKQSSAEAGEGGEGWEPVIPKPKGYVEPNPEFFRRLNNLIDLSYSGLENMGLLPAELAAKTQQFRKLVDRLEVLAELELRGESFSEHDYQFIRRYGSEIEYLCIFFYEATRQIFHEELSLIADVANDRLNNRILHEAVGRIREMDVIVEMKERNRSTAAASSPITNFLLKGDG